MQHEIVLLAIVVTGNIINWQRAKQQQVAIDFFLAFIQLELVDKEEEEVEEEEAKSLPRVKALAFYFCLTHSLSHSVREGTSQSVVTLLFYDRTRV